METKCCQHLRKARSRENRKPIMNAQWSLGAGDGCEGKAHHRSRLDRMQIYSIDSDIQSGAGRGACEARLQ